LFASVLYIETSQTETLMVSIAVNLSASFFTNGQEVKH
jgi:hypothetical protein